VSDVGSGWAWTIRTFFFMVTFHRVLWVEAKSRLPRPICEIEELFGYHPSHG
jgi:hypothetical protein